MADNEIRIRIEELERELEKAPDKDHINELIEELNFYEMQYCEKY